MARLLRLGLYCLRGGGRAGAGERGSRMVPEDASAAVLPSLPLGAWEGTKETLHRYAQVVGKVRLANAPFKNHWWHVTLSGTAGWDEGALWTGAED